MTTKYPLELFVHMDHSEGYPLLVVYQRLKNGIIMSMLLKDRTYIQNWKAQRNGWVVITKHEERSSLELTHPMLFEGKWPELRDLIKAQEAMLLIKEDRG